MKQEHHGIFWGIVAAVASALTAVCIKMTPEVPFEVMVFIRFFIAFFYVLPAILQKKVHLHLKFFPKHILRALTGVLAIYCYFFSVTKLDLVNAVTLSNTAPLFMPFVVYFWMRLVVPIARIIALGVGFIGILLILRPATHVEHIPVFVGLLGGLSSATALIGIRQLSKTESTQTIMSYYFVISLVVLLIPAAIYWKPIHSLVTWGYLAVMGLTSVIYQYCLTRALTHAPSSKIGTLSYLSVVFSGIFGWWIFNEKLDGLTVAGVSLIIVGGLISVLSKEAPRKRS